MVVNVNIFFSMSSTLIFIEFPVSIVSGYFILVFIKIESFSGGSEY